MTKAATLAMSSSGRRPPKAGIAFFPFVTWRMTAFSLKPPSVRPGLPLERLLGHDDVLAALAAAQGLEDGLPNRVDALGPPQRMTAARARARRRRAPAPGIAQRSSVHRAQRSSWRPRAAQIIARSTARRLRCDASAPSSTPRGRGGRARPHDIRVLVAARSPQSSLRPFSFHTPYISTSAASI